MDGILDDKRLDEMKQWKCQKGHVMGVYESTHVETKIDRQSVRYRTVKLIIFRQAINMESDLLVDSVPGCGCIREWNPDDEALDWLKKRFEGNKK